MTQYKDIAIVFDCGATNVRVIAMDTSGHIVAQKSMANETDEDPYYVGGRIWDVEKMWGKLLQASLEVTSAIDSSRIAGVTVTTFGVDGTFCDQTGNLLYPVISWQCSRTEPIMGNIDAYMALEELYGISGIYPYAFNTINKIIWFKENRPDIIDSAHCFMFMPSLFIHKLTGELKNDVTMAGTSMMTDLTGRCLSRKILKKIGLETSLFGSLAEPGDQVGVISVPSAGQTGLPAGTPVFAAGHDTQFAIFGSGAVLDQAVLSSGTWEILMVRSTAFTATKKELSVEITTEFDAIPGIYNIGQNWLGSGVLEWFASNFYRGLQGKELYRVMIEEAEKIRPGSHNLKINPDFSQDSLHSGIISGLTLHSSRAEIYLALLESLAYRLRQGMDALKKAGGLTPSSIICVGGGSKNALWNRLRADVCQVPVELIAQKETTVLGASFFVFSGAGIFSSPEKAREQVSYKPQVVYPSELVQFYDEEFEKQSDFLANLT